MLIYYNNNTKTLTIPNDYNDELTNIPNNTENIIFDETINYSRFNQEIKENVLPNSLHTLTFGDNFNQKIKENVLPNSLHTLTFGAWFNQEIKENVLPCSLHTLKFGYWFNQAIKENVLPCSLHTLILGYHFNQAVNENILPKSLHTLSCGFYLTRKDIVLPKSIKIIYLYAHCKLIDNLPLQIEEVYIDFHDIFKYDDKEISNLPMKYKRLGKSVISFSITNLPITLNKIYIKNKKYLKYFTKIPFGCDIVIKNYEIKEYVYNYY